MSSLPVVAVGCRACTASQGFRTGSGKDLIPGYLLQNAHESGFRGSSWSSSDNGQIDSEYVNAEYLNPDKFPLCSKYLTDERAGQLRRQYAAPDTDFYQSCSDHQKLHTCIVPTGLNSSSLLSSSYHTTRSQILVRSWSLERSIYHDTSDTVVSAIRKVDCGGIPRQIVFLHT